MVWSRTSTLVKLSKTFTRGVWSRDMIQTQIIWSQLWNNSLKNTIINNPNYFRSLLNLQTIISKKYFLEINNIFNSINELHSTNLLHSSFKNRWFQNRILLWHSLFTVLRNSCFGIWSLLEWPFLTINLPSRLFWRWKILLLK